MRKAFNTRLVEEVWWSIETQTRQGRDSDFLAAEASYPYRVGITCRFPTGCVVQEREQEERRNRLVNPNVNFE